jgi:hypothetical protein
LSVSACGFSLPRSWCILMWVLRAPATGRRPRVCLWVAALTSLCLSSCVTLMLLSDVACASSVSVQLYRRLELSDLPPVQCRVIDVLAPPAVLDLNRMDDASLAAGRVIEPRVGILRRHATRPAFADVMDDVGAVDIDRRVMPIRSRL